VSCETDSLVGYPQGRRILVADDTRDCALSLALLLEFEGHEVRVAYNALEAVTLAERFRPAIIVMDIGLPAVDGFEAIRQIRAERRGRDIVICALTGYDGLEHLRRSKELGVNHHLAKPPDPQTLPASSRPPSEKGRCSS